MFNGEQAEQVENRILHEYKLSVHLYKKIIKICWQDQSAWRFASLTLYFIFSKFSVGGKKDRTFGFEDHKKSGT